MGRRAKDWDTNKWVKPIPDFEAEESLPPLNTPLLLQQPATAMYGGFHYAYNRGVCTQHGQNGNHSYTLEMGGIKVKGRSRWKILADCVLEPE